MPKIFDLPSVRGGDDGFPVHVYRDDETGTLYLRAINEGGFACVDIDLCDLAAWLGITPSALDAAVAAGEHPE